MLLATAVWLLVATHPIAAREAVDTASLHPGITNLLQPGYLEGRLATYSNQTGLAAAEVQELLKVGQQCLALRGDLIRLDSERQAFLATTQSASNRLVELNLRLKERVSEAGIDLPPDASVSVIKQKAAEIEADLAVARAELDRLDLEPKRRADRRIKIAGLLADSRRDSGELDDAPEQGVDSPDAEPLKQALAIRRALQTELNLQTVRNLNLELASFEATTDLVTAQQALARRKVAFLDKQLARVKDALNRGRQQESARAALEAERAQQRADALNLPTVTALAETNKELAQVRVSVAKLMAETSRQLDEAEQQWRILHSNHESIRQLVQIAKESGVAQDTAIGLALRQEQYSLPSEKHLREEIKERAEQMTVARIESSKLGDRERANVDIENRLAEIRASLPAELQTWQKEEAIEECRRLLEEQRRLFTDLSADYDNLVAGLARLISVQREWLSEIQQFNSLIKEQVLWFRSTDVLRVEGIRNEIRSLSGVIATDVRSGLVPYLRKDARAHPLTYLVALLLLIALLAFRPLLTRGLLLNCPTQASEGRLSLKPALLSLLFTSVLTLPIPATLLFFSWRLAAYSGGTPLAEHWSHAFLFSGSGVLVIEFFRQICRIPGLAVAHLRWPEHNARLVRFHFSWVLLVGIPLGILSDLLEGVFITGVSNRLLFIIGQIVLLLLGHLLLRARGGLRFSTHDGEHPVQKPLRLQRLYHGVAILIPLVLITFSAMGYTYTARQIWLRVGDSIEWGLVVLLATMLVLHWLTVLRRRMAMRKAEERKAAEDASESLNEAGPDSWQVYSQSRRMFATFLWIIMGLGLWLIWSDMMPALKKLDRIPVPFLSQTGIGPTSATMLPPPALVTPVGQPPQEPTVAPEDAASGLATGFLSVGDVIGAALVLLLTMAASRNLPGFVEMVLLSRVRFRQGEGYAIVTVLRYMVLLLGIGWALTLLGISWSKVQWLAAAVTVGIGFGLQEIFANFVSGLILLFERPVRVGDVITVGTVTGKVTRIQMRATTVRNWDQQELVLPNKDLITGQVINWTLSNDVSRLAITVGLSYDADVKRATELLLAIARENPNVRNDPEPFVAFEEFADSTLNLVLRAYVSIDVRLSTRSQLNNAILERFRKERIEIAYPQRDLHIRSVTTEFPPLRPAKDTEQSSGAP